ncbi:hypothetical protein BDY19DRAFT_988637 [Irpex rosettiformis]|uniref:Uncharacterized protein n=1 Tax=Irpex rosettiformis TaxID=378272 RepID=A0ACB8UKQ9_9APHY|nr:hypothetical protein BDY19DRAFT_988637 [Irpex rosettiformis]
MSYFRPPDVPGPLQPGYPFTPQGKQNIIKRIIVCCDGTWQDGLVAKERWKYTNVLRLARAINHTDERFSPHVPQVVFYQSGVGTFGDKVIEQLDGIVGASLAEKVQEAYAFIAHNYRPGDEIFLFGFSRGAYTARMIALLIGAIGVLDRTEMDHFADIFMAYQKRGKAENHAEITALDSQLAPWTAHNSPGKIRADSDKDTFSIKCIGVFDTVGSLGLPGELNLSAKMKTLFGFPDRFLGQHIERAFQALAIDEHRKDFDCARFEQTLGGRQKGQVLRQCWFAGSHSDIGGGFQSHDLSDVSLTWMLSNVEDILSLDYKYIQSLPDAVAPWGELAPHKSDTGIYAVADTIQRTLPTETDDVTHEKIHSSVLQQRNLNPAAANAIAANRSLVAPLNPLEEFIKDNWRITHVSQETVEHDEGHGKDHKELTEILHAAKQVLRGGESLGKALLHSVKHKGDAASTDTSTTYDELSVAKLMNEHSMSPVFKEIARDH